jgi:PKD repeat protein
VAAPVVVGTPTSAWNGTSVNTLTINKPTGVQDGDYLVAFLRAQSPTATSDYVSSGWTRISSAFVANQAGPRVMGIYALPVPSAAALTATSFTFTFGGTASRVIGSIAIVRGVDLSSPVVADSGSYGGTSITNGSRQNAYADSAGVNSIALAIFGGELVAGNTNASTIATSPTTATNTIFANDTANDGTTGTTGSRTTLVALSYPGAATVAQVSVTWGTITGSGSQGVILRGGNILPVASFTYGNTNLLLSVDGTGSTDSDGTIASYAWDFGDGNTGTGSTTTHTYTSAGTYTVSLTVTDNSGGANTTTHSVTVTAAAPSGITVRSYTTLTAVGNVDSSATPGPVITPPADLAVGDYLMIGVFFAQDLGSSAIVVPSGFTQLTSTGTSSNRLYVVYGRAMTTSADVTAVASGVYLRAAGTATRIVAIAAALRGVSAFSSAGALTFVNSTTSGTSYSAPATGDVRFYFVVTNSSSPSTSPAHTPLGGIKVVQAMSPSGASSPYSDSQMSLMIGGTGASYAVAVANGGSVGVGFTSTIADTPPVAAFTTSVSGLNLTVNASTSSDSDGTISAYGWDFGDGSTDIGVTPTVHTYGGPGTYTVTLTITDNGGVSSSTTHSVVVGGSSSAIAPTRVGYSFLDPSTSNTMLLDPSVPTGGAAIATGHWIIAAFALYNGTITITPPSGWTVLKAYGTIGTLGYAAYGRIRQSGDTSYTFTTDSNGNVGAAALMWGDGADPTITNWVVGAEANRSISTQNTAPSLTTTVDHSLVLGLSFERTSATESAITSLTGASEWFFMPQYSTSQLQTLDVGYIADVTPIGATSTMTWTYPNTQAVNGAAFQIAIAPTPTNTNISVGYPGVLRTSGGPNYNGKLFYWDGSAAHDFSTTLTKTFTPVTVSQFLSPDHSPWFGAHRGFSYSYPEETLYSYRGATDWGIKAIEVSVQKSASGTFWCFHDATTDRTTGVSGTISSMTDAQISVLNNIGTTAAGNSSQPARPTAKLVDVLNLYAATHVIIIEDKTYANTTAMLNLMDSYGTVGRPANEIFIWKVASSSSKTNFFDPATARGYHRWAYIFDGSMSTEFPALPASGKADMIGMDFNSSDATLSSAISQCISNGVMPTGHIINSTTQRDRLLGLGMKGLMMSNKDAVPPWYNIW